MGYHRGPRAHSCPCPAGKSSWSHRLGPHNHADGRQQKRVLGSDLHPHSADLRSPEEDHGSMLQGSGSLLAQERGGEDASRARPRPVRAQRTRPRRRQPTQDKHRPQDAKPSQAVWEVKMWNWNNPVQMALGITQFERRLGAPMHGLMNAYQPKLQEGGADPKVGDLALGGQGGSLAGQSALQQEAAQPHKDRPCRDVWYDPLKQHVEHTEIERQAFASASQKTRRPPEPLPHQSSALLRGGGHRALVGPLQV